MQLEFRTRVNSSIEEIKSQFDAKLFKKLAPPFLKLEVIEFGGCKLGDTISLRLVTPVFKGDWKSVITEEFQSESEWYFVDEGRILPAPFISWKHNHIVKEKGKYSDIIDRIEFKCANRAIELVMTPGLALSFLYRKPIYKKIFK
jgi:ligand-binding SRPBCC domain-containing protein